MTTTGRQQVASRAWVVGAVIAVVMAAIAFWHLGGDDGPPEPPTVAGSPILIASGGIPFAWNVTVSPGEGGQLCGHGTFGMQAEDRTGQLCSVVAGPDAVGNELFGSGGSSTNPEGQTLVWGLVDPDVTEVVVELTDGSKEMATVAVGGGRGSPDDRVAVWAFATESDIEARVARSEDGTEERRLDLQESMRPPAGEVRDPSELPGLEG